MPSEPEQSFESALLSALFDSALDALLVTDTKGRIERANGVAGLLFNCAPGELIGKKFDQCLTLPPGQTAEEFLVGALRLAGHRGQEMEGRRSDGTPVPLRLSVGRAATETAESFVFVLHDLSERRATEAALARSQRLDAIGQMTGGIAHDFNNLLTVIIGNLELLDMRAADPGLFGLIADALEAAEMGADLTARLLVFARRCDLKPVQSDLAQLCDQTLAILRRTLGSRVHLRAELETPVAPVLIDPGQLQSALLNLALNARDAMPEGGELLISLSNVTIDDSYMAQETDIAEGHYVRLAVSDNGVGMSEEAQKRAFEPFFSTKGAQGGTGLGLAMVYGFVRQSGGHITLYSEAGHGTSFGLYFPALSGEVPLAKAEPTVLGEKPLAGSNRRVLVVEDNAKIRQLAVTRLESLGFATSEAADADEALESLRKGPVPDLVFSDLVMPGQLSGYDLADMILREFPQVKVLLTSGYASDVVTNAMAGDHTFEILHKPYRMVDLKVRLEAIFQ